MKKMLLKVAAVAALFTFIGCGNHDDAEDDIKWSDDNGGTLEVFNGSNKDVVLFQGATPTKESIMGGIRAGATKKFDVSGFSDFSVGGYSIIRGITREEYNKTNNNLNSAKWEFSAFATYKAGVIYRISIGYDYWGDNAIRVHNRGNIGLELRKDSPEGEKVAYLPRLKQNEMIYTSNTNSITLFPVYVFYNKSTQEINTLYAADMFETVEATPRPAANQQGLNDYYFPNDPQDSWAKIVGTLKSPVAYITVSNTVLNQGARFTAGSKRLYSQDGYDAIGSGERLIFEVDGGDYNEETGIGGMERELYALYYGGSVTVGVLMEKRSVIDILDDNDEVIRQDITTDYVKPIIKNGYNYTLSISGSGQDPAGYRAILVEGDKRDLAKDLLVSQ